MRISYGYHNLEKALGHLLGKQVAHRSANMPLGRILKSTFSHLVQETLDDEYDMKMLRLAFLTQDLLRLKAHRPEFLRAFRKRIRVARSDDHFLGIRFELKLASSLTRYGIAFSMPDPPDFAIKTGDTNVFLECGSARVSRPKVDLLYKVHQEIRDKSTKPYAGRATALFIDTTNLMFHGLGMTSPTAMQELKPKVAEMLPSANMGSVLLYGYILNPAMNRLEHNYIRVDDARIETRLVQVLNAFSPVGRVRIEKPRVAKEG